MIKLTPKNIEVAQPLVEERIKSAGIEDRCSVDYIFPIIEANQEAGTATVFVDRVKDPQAILILAYVPSSICDEVSVIMNLVYTSNEVREKNPRLSIELMNEMFATAESFARGKRADVLQAASWIYRGAPDISHILEKKGFEPQTREFIKLLNQPHDNEL